MKLPEYGPQEVGEVWRYTPHSVRELYRIDAIFERHGSLRVALWCLDTDTAGAQAYMYDNLQEPYWTFISSPTPPEDEAEDVIEI